MLVLFKNIKEENILIFDAEYNEGDLIQFAAILFRRVYKDVFQINKSINFFVKLEEGKKINYFIERFTGISDQILEQFGIDLNQAISELENLLDWMADLLVVSHGLYNDRITLESNGFNLFEKEDVIFKGYCTYNNGKRILQRDKNLKLEDLAEEAGLFLSSYHDAFKDTMATVAVFSLLCKLEDEQKEEDKNDKILQSWRNKNN